MGEKKLKITCCVDEEQGQCKRCADEGIGR